MSTPTAWTPWSTDEPHELTTPPVYELHSDASTAIESGPVAATYLHAHHRSTPRAEAQHHSTQDVRRRAPVTKPHRMMRMMRAIGETGARSREKRVSDGLSSWRNSVNSTTLFTWPTSASTARANTLLYGIHSNDGGAWMVTGARRGAATHEPILLSVRSCA